MNRESPRTTKKNINYRCCCLPQWRGKTRAEIARREKAVRAYAVGNWSNALRGPSEEKARWLFLFSPFSIQLLRLLNAALARWKIRLSALLRQALLLSVTVRSMV